MDEGIVRQPKWGHLKELRKAIKLCEAALVNADANYRSLSFGLEAHVCSAGSGTCAAFLANINAQSDATVKFSGNSYHFCLHGSNYMKDTVYGNATSWSRLHEQIGVQGSNTLSSLV